MARVPLTTETASPAKLVIRAESIDITPENFLRLCRDNPDFRLELTAHKEIEIMAPTGSESGFHNLEIDGQLWQWAKRDRNGVTFDSNTMFQLPNGALRVPDGAWLRREKWNALTKDQRRKPAPVCPDFVMELRSPNDSLRDLQEKMEEYIANGSQLGWLIDPIERKVHVYRPGQAPECLDSPESVCGDPVLRGFKLHLTEVFTA